MGTSVSPWHWVVRLALETDLFSAVAVAVARKVGRCRLTLSNPR